MKTPNTQEAVVLGVVTVCATVAGVLHAIDPTALGTVYGGVIGWGLRASTGS